MRGLITRGLIVAALATVALAESTTVAEPTSRPAEGSVAGKRLIEFGWDEPDTAFMRKHAAQMDATPFDGCVYHMRYMQPDGKDADFIWSCWGRRAFTTEQVQHAIDDLRATRFKRLRHNFLRFNVTPGDLDWFDDYSAVINNARLAARVAREGGVGILFDTEQYNGPLFDYRKQPGASTRTWEQYADQARKRGREVMQAFQEGFPGLKVLMTFGYGGPWQESDGGKRPLSECGCGLLSPFLDGMIEAAEGSTQLIDGWESAYSYFEEKKFRKARQMIHEDVLAMVADREKYRKVFSASFGLWMDYRWKEQGWEVEHPERNPWPPDKFEGIVRTALKYADEYVWIYSEAPRWWSDGGGPVKLSPEYGMAIRRAAGRLPASGPGQEACTSTRVYDSPEGMYHTFGTDADPASAALFRSLGVTSVESYVTWETCEREAEGKWDWSRWDKQVRVLQDNGLKWVPFLIVGPAYATPAWFQAGKEHFACRCLEHGTDSKIESLWNPNLPKWIDRFIGEFARRYRDNGAIESVLLGVQGDFGEAIYSVSGGGWTGDYHQHAGYWCDDPHALADFRGFVGERYSSVQALNKAWGTSYGSFDEADFPGRGAALAEFQKTVAAGEPGARRRWLDFNDWYRGSMTRWSDWWLATARKHFPKTPIYLCTGGDASPPHGSNFAEQCRVAAKHRAGVRITNEASQYALNWALTRWVASAGKHYGAYYGFEPAGNVDEGGIVARIYNASASGANQLFEYNQNVVSAKSRMDMQRANLKHLYRTEPVVPVAIWYPNNVALTLNWTRFLDLASAFRDYFDFDFVDETMLRTGAIEHYKVLVILHGKVMERQDAERIARWIEKGGRAIVAGVANFESVEGTDEPEKTLMGESRSGRSIGKGSICRLENQEEAASQLGVALRDLGLAVYDLKKDGVYGTQIGRDSFVFLNTGKEPAEAQVSLGAGKSRRVVVPAGGIARLDGE